MSQTKTALIVEGGAMRGAFSTGVLDGFLAEEFRPFDLYIGVSAGAANLAAFLAGMPERNLKIYTDYALRPDFINLWRFLKGGHLIDLDWLWDITIKEIRLNIPRIQETTGEFIVVATDIHQGRPVYFSGKTPNIENILLASSALPLIFRRFPIVDGLELSDGGLADPLPIREAIQRGAKKIMVIRSRSMSYSKKISLGDLYLGLKYAQLSSLFQSRVQNYNEALSMIRNPPEDIDIVEVCPPPELKTSRLTRKKEPILNSYESGVRLSKTAIEHWLAKDTI
ncbi:patatin-like phospholipase family protein [Alkalimarinus sediminis]|uniref:Patatin family protein n=1 Tax=Alkalimarinus sediminis TaxID=1632866 RepID=A0A9E8HTJ8_9ALTE|nr:patatin family protein [Alkalimarinus sediminis]UZW76256.1 patatin family protein [Alkalimarinus sediminis]